MAERVYARQWHASKDAQAWRVLPEGATAFFRTDSFEVSVRFLDAVGALVGQADPPYVDIRGDGVTVLLRSFRQEYGLFQADFDLALAISKKAQEMGLAAEPAAIQSLSMIPGAKDRRQIMPFWQAVLAYRPRPDSPAEDLVDPHDRLAPFWFEEMDELRPDGKGTVHFVVWVPWDQADARLAAALAAGGEIVMHHAEENYWTLADPAGNQIDLATTAAPETSD
jgi:4a-hydroxytetrahydrobiopterin dehydratase